MLRPDLDGPQSGQSTGCDRGLPVLRNCRIRRSGRFGWFAAGAVLAWAVGCPAASGAQVAARQDPDERATEKELQSLVGERRFAEAEELATRALDEAERQDGEESLQAARWHMWLGRIGNAGAGGDQARNHLEQAVAITKKQAPKEEIAAEAVDEMGNWLCGERRYEEAAPLFEKGLAIRRNLYGENSLELVVSLENLARCKRLMRRYDDAEPLLVEALEIRERRLGPEHRSTAISLRHLGDLKRARWEYAAARPLLEKALAIRERVYGSEHPLFGESLHDLAALDHEQGRHDEAVERYKRALILRLETLGIDDPETQSTVTALAKLYRELDREEAAERLEQDPSAFVNVKSRDAARSSG
jgi:tetratricopeptide (TPR) repeat protein